MTTATQKPTAETLGLIYDEVAESLNLQFEEIDLLNGRAQSILGWAGIVLGIFVSLRPPTDDAIVSILFGVALVGFLNIARCALRAWRIIGWRRDPSPDAMWKQRLQSEEWMRHRIILNRLQSRGVNEAVIRRKRVWLERAQRYLALEVVYLVAIAILLPYLSD